MSPRPLALVAGLAVCDYLLWNWSLSAHQDVPALVAGLTLPPLCAACLLMFVLGLARVISRSANRSSVARSAARAENRRAHARPTPHNAARARTRHRGEDAEPAIAGREPEARPSRKLAA